MSVQALLIVLMMGIEVYRPLREMRALMHQGMVAQAASIGVFELLDSTPRLKDAASRAPVGDMAPTVEFDHVRFSYPGGRRAVHEDFTFKVRGGGADRRGRSKRRRQNLHRETAVAHL